MARDLTPADVAEALHLHVDTVRDLARRGKLKGYLVGNRWRFRPVAVEDFRVSCEPKDFRPSQIAQIVRRVRGSQSSSPLLAQARSSAFYRKRHGSKAGANA